MTPYGQTTYLERRIFCRLATVRFSFYGLLLFFETLNLLKSDYLHYELMRYTSLRIFGWQATPPFLCYFQEYVLLLCSYVALSVARSVAACLVSLICSPFHHTLVSFLATSLYWYALDEFRPENVTTATGSFDAHRLSLLLVCRALAFNALLFKRWVGDELTTSTDNLFIWTREQRLRFHVLRQLLVGVLPNLLKILVLNRFRWIVFGAQREIVVVAMLLVLACYLSFAPYCWRYSWTVRMEERTIVLTDRQPHQPTAPVIVRATAPPLRFGVISELRVNRRYCLLQTINSLLWAMQQLLYVAYLVYAHLYVGLNFVRDLVYCHTIRDVMKTVLNGLYVRFVDRHALTGVLLIFLYGLFGLFSSTGIVFYLYYTYARIQVEAFSTGLCLLTTICFFPMFAARLAQPTYYSLLPTVQRRLLRRRGCYLPFYYHVFLVRLVRFSWPFFNLPLIALYFIVPAIIRSPVLVSSIYAAAILLAVYYFSRQTTRTALV